MHDRHDLLNMLAELVALHSAAVGLAQQAYALVAAGELSQPNPPPQDETQAFHSDQLLVSTVTCCVQWCGRRCILGPSLLFRMLHRLSRHPNRFFTYDMLKDEVWQGQCTDDAVRALVKRLRCALKEADMADLASCIQVQDRCVGLLLDGRIP